MRRDDVLTVLGALERVPAGDVTTAVGTAETLDRMKRNTVRLRDRDDAQRLATAFGFGTDQGPDVPVARYRDVADMPGPRRARSALEGLAGACDASVLSEAFGAARIGPRGVRRFRSVEEADAHRQAWTTGAEVD